MELRGITINKRFVPEFNNNKKLPIDKQIVIHFARIPGTAEEKNYKNMSVTKDGTYGVLFKDDMLLSSYIERIENLKVAGVKVDTGQKLVEAVAPELEDLFTEVRDYLFPEAEEFAEGEQEA